MKLVIYTQFCENYGAHDWDGKGACPQYWKNKGGDTYVVEVSLAEAQNPAFYAAVEKCIEHSSDYSEEYIVGQDLVDDCDFDPSTLVAEWETVTYARLSIDGHLNCEKDVRSYGMSNTVVGQRSWKQDENGQRECSLIRFEEAA
jgi:hypothetical protein